MDDAIAGRPPTSHERMAGQPWDASYRDGPAPWDTGEPETAVAAARQKVHDRGIAAEFATADALALERLQRVFDSVLDCGLFHTFDADERRRYVASLSSVTKRDGTLYVLCFSDIGSDIGPHPVGREDLGAAFNPGSGWNVSAIEPERIHTRFHGEHGAPAWLATVTRV